MSDQSLLQVENLTRKAQHQEVELERTSKQLKEAIRKKQQNASSKGSDQVTTSQGRVGKKDSCSRSHLMGLKAWFGLLKEMAERLPVGAARNINLPCFTAFSANIVSNEVSNASVDRLNGQITFQEPDSNGSNGQLLSNGSSISSNRSSGQNRQAPSETTMRNGSRTKEGDSRNDNEWVEQDESGVYITLTSLPGGVKDLKRVRFSRKRFSEKEAEQWWAENRARVYERYNVRTVDKSSVGVGSEDLAH
ncbi:hypothetical protein HYC85_022581 [Camellia sinensis]|uniref:BRX domain-containing protein n=1 Tax=Camellia sinensis TaxID=4442 RepID=A0A7J7GC77_CAMSI|nr:hypothetical protein HYC85_022581 [Camellia sinensis]